MVEQLHANRPQWEIFISLAVISHMLLYILYIFPRANLTHAHKMGNVVPITGQLTVHLAIIHVNSSVACT